MSVIALGVRLFFRYFSFSISGRREETDHSLLLKSFLISQGRLLSIINGLGGTKKSRFDEVLHHLPRTLNISTEVVDEASRTLRTEGWYKMPVRLDETLVRKLNKLLSEGQMRLVSDDPSVDGKWDNVDFDNPRAEKYDLPPEAFVGDEDVQRLMVDRGIVEIARNYIGADPIIDIAAAWHSFPAGRSSNQAATQFHFDLDRVRWLKVFFFLTPISRRTGSHLFVPQTHVDGGIPISLLQKGYKRLTDDEVKEHFPESTWVIPEGAEGTILLEDTRGLHKGLPLMEGHRLVLQFQYSSSLFGNPTGLPRFTPSSRSAVLTKEVLDSSLFQGFLP